MSQTTNVEQVKFNIMTQEQFNSITPNFNELYMIIDASGVTKAEVIAALGYTPYNANNPAGYISSASVGSLTDVSLANLTNGQFLRYNATSHKWENVSSSATVSWGGITGDINNQTDLKNALDSKASVTFRDWSAS